MIGGRGLNSFFLDVSLEPRGDVSYSDFYCFWIICTFTQARYFPHDCSVNSFSVFQFWSRWDWQYSRRLMSLNCSDFTPAYYLSYDPWEEELIVFLNFSLKRKSDWSFVDSILSAFELFLRSPKLATFFMVAGGDISRDIRYGWWSRNNSITVLSTVMCSSWIVLLRSARLAMFLLIHGWGKNMKNQFVHEAIFCSYMLRQFSKIKGHSLNSNQSLLKLNNWIQRIS